MNRFYTLNSPQKESIPSEMDQASDDPKTSIYHFSSTFPGLTAINRRRRVTCKKCDLPVGYAYIDQAYLEFKSNQAEEDCQAHSGERNFEFLMIPRPINISVNPIRRGSCEIPESANPYMTLIIKNAEGNIFDADEIVCDGCGSSLGTQITSFELFPPANDLEICQPIKDKEETSQYHIFSTERVKVEPMFRNIGLKELSTTYYGGEKHFDEFQPIEDSDIYSNDSKFWMRPHERVLNEENGIKEEKQSCSWPSTLVDLVRRNELPKGTLN
ncbi:unnamed protein product [Rodentolepis nana]|uniref:Yippee domain-containing protein n=1 Tax=Rodentolepis nana TaxID=102285 RepID=A0A0R3TV30_RODNA|nr:unnamed protein product [Rodentolepis nana]